MKLEREAAIKVLVDAGMSDEEVNKLVDDELETRAFKVLQEIARKREAEETAPGWEAEDYRQAMEVTVDLRECLNRLYGNAVLRENSQVSAQLSHAVADFEKGLCDLLSMQPPHATEVIFDSRRDFKKWVVEPTMPDTQGQKPWCVKGPGAYCYMMAHEENANRLCHRLNRSYDLGKKSRDLEFTRLEEKNDKQNVSLRNQVDLLGKDIMKLDIGLPRCDKDHPNGMGACEAAAIGLKEQRDRVMKLEGESSANVIMAAELLFKAHTETVPSEMRNAYDAAMLAVRARLAVPLSHVKQAQEPLREGEAPAEREAVRNRTASLLIDAVDDLMKLATEERPGLTIPVEFDIAPDIEEKVEIDEKGNVVPVEAINWEPKRDENGDVLLEKKAFQFHEVTIHLKDGRGRPFKDKTSPFYFVSHQFRIIGPGIDPLKVQSVRILEGGEIRYHLDYRVAEKCSIKKGFITDENGRLICTETERFFRVWVESFVVEEDTRIREEIEAAKDGDTIDLPPGVHVVEEGNLPCEEKPKKPTPPPNTLVREDTAKETPVTAGFPPEILQAHGLEVEEDEEEEKDDNVDGHDESNGDRE